jgi:hypothetical protein
MLMKLIEVSPYLLVGLALVLHAAAYYINARAKADPAKTWEDEYAPTVQNVADLGFKAVEWLGSIKGWDGATKLDELLKLTRQVEELYTAGKKTEAVTRLLAYYWDARGKAGQAGLIPVLPDAVKNPPSAPVSR